MPRGPRRMRMLMALTKRSIGALTRRCLSKIALSEPAVTMLPIRNELGDDCSWHFATGDILTAGRRFRGIAEVTGPAACSPGSRLTHGNRSRMAPSKGACTGPDAARSSCRHGCRLTHPDCRAVLIQIVALHRPPEVLEVARRLARPPALCLGPAPGWFRNLGNQPVIRRNRPRRRTPPPPCVRQQLQIQTNLRYTRSASGRSSNLEKVVAAQQLSLIRRPDALSSVRYPR